MLEFQLNENCFLKAFEGILIRQKKPENAVDKACN